jgi:hypothetical protein
MQPAPQLREPLSQIVRDAHKGKSTPVSVSGRRPPVQPAPAYAERPLRGHNRAEPVPLHLVGEIAS